jgi:hypothetical protein
MNYHIRKRKKNPFKNLKTLTPQFEKVQIKFDFFIKGEYLF